MIEGAWYGMGIAFSYDILRILRRVVHFKPFGVGVQDFLFWMATGLVVFSMIFQYNDGIVRGYIFLTLILGAWLYTKSISKPFVKYTSKILNFLFTFLLKKPLKWFRIFVIRFFRMFGRPIWVFGRWLRRKIKGRKQEYGEKRKQ